MTCKDKPLIRNLYEEHANTGYRIDDLDRMRGMLGCNPIEGMVRIAMDESQPMQLRAIMYRELAQYVAPKRKAMEVTGEEGGPVKIEITVRKWLDSINGKSMGLPSERKERYANINVVLTAGLIRPWRWRRFSSRVCTTGCTKSVT